MRSHSERLLEAFLFLGSGPQSKPHLAEQLGVDSETLDALLKDLETYWRATESAFALRSVAGGVEMTTAPDLAEDLEARAARDAEPLSMAAWETLAVVAYRQPVTRLEIEAIRGVHSERALATLQNRSLIDEVGRKDVPGRPILYGVTPWFLETFGLNSVDELPPLPEPPALD